MKNEQNRSYWSHEIAKLLGISISALRKWSLALEACGYCFIRDKNDKRAYLECDIMPLRKMQELLHNQSGLENAAKVITSRFFNTRTTPVLQHPPHYSSTTQTGTTGVLQQNELVLLTNQLKAIEEENKKLHEYLQRLERRTEKHNESITQILRQQLELRKILSSTQQKKWWRFWT